MPRVPTAWLTVIWVGLLIALAVIRVAATYPVFSQTSDEPAHLGAGMEWLSRGTYDYEPLHPPLARIAVAAMHRLRGYGGQGENNLWDEGARLLNLDVPYQRTLTWARLGSLPFLALGSLAFFGLVSALNGREVGLIALGFLTTTPTILAHAGLATTDLAFSACWLAALYAFERHLRQPAARNTVLLGIALGLAMLTKMSALMLIPVGFAAVVLARRRGDRSPRPLALAAAGVIALLSMWSCYRFSVGPILQPGDRVDSAVSAVFGGLPRVEPHVREALRHVPAPEYWMGLRQLISRNEDGNVSYFLGQVHWDGVWYYFPLILLMKLPLPTTLLALFSRGRGYLAPALIIAATLLLMSQARLNIGSRHILPLFAMAAWLAAGGVHRLWRRSIAGKGLAGLLVAWQLAAGAFAHPDYLTYFNEAVPRPYEAITVDSDLDWGQDLLRLRDYLEAEGIDDVSVAYFGSADVSRHIPYARTLPPDQVRSGYIAISVSKLKLGDYPYKGYLPPDQRRTNHFEWLESYEPQARIGASILLYRIP